MVAYSFHKMFAEPIIQKRKTHTIRAHRTGRSRHARRGDKLQIFTGLRTPQTRLLGNAECVDADPIMLVLRLDGEVSFPSGVYDVFNGPGLNVFARSDGFQDWEGLLAFWRKNHPKVTSFDGIMIEWGMTFLRSMA